MSHDLTSISVIARLFDFLLAHNPAMVSYLGVTVSRYLADSQNSAAEMFAADHPSQEGGASSTR